LATYCPTVSTAMVSPPSTVRKVEKSVVMVASSEAAASQAAITASRPAVVDSPRATQVTLSVRWA
jgi:hypothetical protein